MSSQAFPKGFEPGSLRWSPSHVKKCTTIGGRIPAAHFSFQLIKNLLMPLFLIGCFPVDFQEVKWPLRTKSVKRPIKVGKRPINEGKRPIKAKVLVGVSVGCLMGCFRAPPPWRKTAPLKRPIKRSMSLVTRPIHPLPYRETGVAIPLSHCVFCGIADYRCYSPTSFHEDALSQSKDRLWRGVSQKKLVFEAYRARWGVARNSIANRAIVGHQGFQVLCSIPLSVVWAWCLSRVHKF